MKAGELKIQLVGYATDKDGTINEIAKSPIVKAIVNNSINGIIKEGNANLSTIEVLKAKVDKLLEEGVDTWDPLSVAYINDEGELVFELGAGLKDVFFNENEELVIEPDDQVEDAYVNDKGQLTLVI